MFGYILHPINSYRKNCILELIQQRDEAKIKEYLSSIDLNSMSNEYQYGILAITMQSDHDNKDPNYTMTSILLDHGANINARIESTPFGGGGKICTNSLLFKAIELNDENIINFLFSKGISPDFSEYFCKNLRYDSTPLDVTIRSNNLPMAELLISKGCADSDKISCVKYLDNETKKFIETTLRSEIEMDPQQGLMGNDNNELSNTDNIV